MGFGVKFWGVRGSIAVPSPKHIKFGGNTSCVEVFAGDRRLILDAGTGIRTLGNELLQAGLRDIHLFLTHTHWDHISGFPFFSPAFNPDCTFYVRAGHLTDTSCIRDVLSWQMNHPMFPVPLDAMKADLKMEDFAAGEVFELCSDLKVRTCPLNHPNGATAYRVEYQGKSICYVTDTEHVPGHPDQNILGLVEGTDLMIYDSTYTEAEFPAKVGWGHSTWNEGVKLAQAANVKQFVLFHHEPDHDDDFMEKLEAEAISAWPHCVAAREGMTIEVG